MAIRARCATGWHRHEHDYVVVPMTTGQLRIDTGLGGDRRVVVGQSYFRNAPVDVINANPHELTFIEVEHKR